ncbi:MAG TPA: phosphotransferase [Stellaceae bacterium]|nr:phosphotransferase [Stellaceae bacterium]
MTERTELIHGFLARAGWGDVPRRPLAGDASFRRYDRLEAPGRRAVLMDAPPPHEDVRPFLTVARLLRKLDLSAPEILAEDIEAGLLLLEDFGDRTYTRLLADGGDEATLYRLAVDVLIALHKRFEPALGAGVPLYDETRLLNEAALLVDWYMPAVSGSSTPPDLRAEYLAMWRALLPLASAVPATLVLRDYHVDNLMLLDGRTGLAACGLLDFQDAVIGSPAYDLVSLLEDARRDVSSALVRGLTEHYLAAFPAVDRAAFTCAAAVLAAQRNCKILGIFTRLCVRDGKPQYLVHTPRLWRLVYRDVSHPALAPVRHWLDRHIPADLRVTPPQGAKP